MSKVGIFLNGQHGDIMSALSVMYYRDELWGDDKIIWYADETYFDLFKYQDIEVRPFPRGFGYPKMVEEENKKLIAAGKEPIWQDWKPLVDERNRLNFDLKKNYPSLDDIYYGYFPAPHQMTPLQRHGLPYPRCSQKVFGVSFSDPWHPVLKFSDEEREEARIFIESMGDGKRVFIESFAGSSQSTLDEGMIAGTILKCTEVWGDCNFIFGSHKFLRKEEKFPAYLFETPNVYSAAHFTVRQCALITDQCDLMISVSSGLTVAASAWGLRQPKTLQFCGSKICSTYDLSTNKENFKLVTADDKKGQAAKAEYYLKLNQLLSQ